VSFIACFVLCVVFFKRGLLFCVMCVICVLCLIVVSLPPGKNRFAVKISNNNNNNSKIPNITPLQRHMNSSVPSVSCFLRRT
jgi:hypothetical protein